MCDNSRSDESDAGLIKRLQNGEIEAFDKLFEKYRRRILAYVYGLVGDRGVAEDIVQDCFVKLARKIKRIDPSKGVSAWLYRVARNHAIDILRHREFEVLPGEEYFRSKSRHGISSSAETPAEKMIADERRANIQKALEWLPRKERDLLLLRFYGDLTFKEIARIVRRPLGTVLWQTRNSMERLRKHLGEHK